MGLPIIYVRGFAGDTLEWRASEDSPETPVPLLTSFLASTQRAVDETGTTLPTVRHALWFRLISLREQGGVVPLLRPPRTDGPTGTTRSSSTSSPGTGS